MAVSNPNNRHDYVATGGQTVFPFTFYVGTAAELLVFTNGVQNISGFSVSGLQNDAGGNVTFAVGKNNGDKVLLLRVETLEQTTVLPAGGPFPAKSVEKMSDKLTRIVQQLDEVDQRTVKLATTSLFSDVVLEDPIAGRFLRWLDNDTIDSAVITPAGSLGVPVGFTDGGTGANYASALALAKGLGLALWKPGADIASAATLTLPDPLDGNIITVTGTTTVTAISTTGIADGTIIVLRNSSTLTYTHGANLQLKGQVNAVLAAGANLFMQLRSGSWREVHREHNASSANAPKYWRGDGTWQRTAISSFITGLTLSNNGGDPTNDIDIAVGATASDDADPFLKEAMYLPSGLTKRLDATWVVGTNQGMLDTGAVGNGTYHIFLIKRTDTGVVDVLASLSPTAPTMPTNYTVKQRIGSITRVGGVNTAFVQAGNYFHLTGSAIPLDVDTATSGTSAVTVALTRVPTGVRFMARLGMFAGSTIATLLTPLDSPDEAPSDSATPLAHGGGNASGVHGQHEILTDTSAQIRRRSAVSGTLKIITRGYTDLTRGVN